MPSCDLIARSCRSTAILERGKRDACVATRSTATRATRDARTSGVTWHRSPISCRRGEQEEPRVRAWVHRRSFAISRWKRSVIRTTVYLINAARPLRGSLTPRVILGLGPSFGRIDLHAKRRGAARRDDATIRKRVKSSDERRTRRMEESGRVVRRPEFAYSIFPIIFGGGGGGDGPVLFYSSAADLPATRSAMRQQRLLPPPLARGIYSPLPHVLHPFSAPLSRLADYNAGTSSVINASTFTESRLLKAFPEENAPSYRKL